MSILWVVCIFCLVGITICLQCSYNIKCSSACLQRYCQYDATSNTYNFTKCCRGCLDEYYWVQSTQQCIQDTCSKSLFGIQKYWWFRNNTCVESCPVQYYFQGYPEMNPWVASNATDRCEKVCPSGYYSYGLTNSSKTCLRDCPSGYYKQTINGSNFCTSSCWNQYGQSFLKLDTNECTSCINLTGYYRIYDFSYGTYLCSTTCPANYTKYNADGNKSCFWQLGYNYCSYPYIFDIQTNSCVFCQHYNSLYSIQSIVSTQQCNRYCPVNYFLYPKLNKCYADCNYITEGWPYYRDYVQQACVQIGQCSFKDNDNLQTFGDNITRNCDDQCSINSYGHPDLKICVADCFGNYPVKNPLTNMCQNYQAVSSPPSDAITLTKSMVTIAAVIGVLVACVIAIIVVLLGHGIERYCCKKNNKYQHVDTQTPPNQQQKGMNSAGSSQFLQQIQIDTQINPQNKKPRRRPSFI